MRRQRVGPLNDTDFAVKLPGKNGRIQAEKLTSPPVAGVMLLLHRCEPVLPEHGTDVLRRSSGEGVVPEERENVRAIGKQTLFGERDKAVLFPIAERGEPEIPVKSWLIRRVNSRRLVDRLRLVTERISRPGLAVVRALELDLIAAAGHHSEEAISVGDAKGVQGPDGRCGQRTLRERY